MILRPQHTQRPIEILLVGPAASGKRTLGKQLIKCRELFFSINTAEKIPMNVFRSLNSLDYVLLMVDMTNRDSLSTLEHTLQHMTPDYLYDKCAAVITKVDSVNQWSLSEDEITNTIHKYTPNLQQFHVNLNHERDRRLVSDQIGRAIRISALNQKDVSTLLLKSLEHYRPITTSIAPPVLESMDDKDDSDNDNDSIDDSMDHEDIPTSEVVVVEEENGQ